MEMDLVSCQAALLLNHQLLNQKIWPCNSISGQTKLNEMKKVCTMLYIATKAKNFSEVFILLNTRNSDSLLSCPFWHQQSASALTLEMTYIENKKIGTVL
jgi:hypothetical protein